MIGDVEMVRSLCRGIYEYNDEEDRIEHENGPCIACKAFLVAIIHSRADERRKLVRQIDETVDAFVEEWRDGCGVILQGHASDSLCDGIRGLVGACVNRGGPIVNQNIK